MQDLMEEITHRIANGERTLITVMTIKFAEEVADYLNRNGIKSHYLHSEIDTIERSEIIKTLRLGYIDVIVGINLLREGLDIPEVSLVAIFDADKEGFLRNERSLLQTIGRAARHVSGTVLMYADAISPAMEGAIKSTLKRRKLQSEYNLKHHYEAKSITKPLPTLDQGHGSPKEKKRQGAKKSRGEANDPLPATSTMREERKMSINELQGEMERAANELDFERAAQLRDLIFELKISTPRDVEDAT